MRIILIVAFLLSFASCNNSSKKTEVKNDSSEKVPEPVKNQTAPDTLFTGMGTEPFWAVYVINNDKIVYHPAEGPDITVPYTAPSSTDEITSKYSSSNDSVTMELTLTKKDCNNGMSDIVYPYQVSLQINAAIFKGCGSQGKN